VRGRADGDVAALIERIRQDASPSLRLLHVGNEAARGDLVGALRASGFEAMFVAAFRAQPVHTPGPLLADQLAGRSYLDAILLHSPRAGAILAGFAAGAKSRAPLRMAAISHAAAEDVRAFADRLEIAQAPNEDALLAALQRMLAEG
jgi:uroporphyrinogen-III synthase